MKKKMIYLLSTLLLGACTVPISTPGSPQNTASRDTISQLFALEVEYRRAQQQYQQQPQKLQQLHQHYQQQFSLLAPAVDDALRLGAVSRHDDHHLLLEQDMLLRLDSLDGAITAILLNAAANGKDLAALRQQIDLAAAQQQSARVLYYNHTFFERRWPFLNGRYTIRYAFDRSFFAGANRKIPYRQLTYKAMAAWETASNNTLSFQETTVAARRSSSQPFLTIKFIHKADSPYAGWANIGALPNSTLTINEPVIRDANDYTRVVLHELGHVLGLMHEHQRGDRNTFIALPEGDNNYQLLPFFYSTRNLEQGVRYQLPNGTTLTLNSPSSPPSPWSHAPLPYDYLSIMHYHSLIAKQTQQGYLPGDTILAVDRLSQYDRAGIKIFYPRW